MPFANPEDKRAYDRERAARLRREWLLANGPCRCGSWEDLEMHHKDPAQKVSHRIWNWSAERRAAELAKCEPLCKRCHKAETRAMLQRHHPCGTRGRYKKGCRCAPCTAANTAYAASRRTQSATIHTQGESCAA